MPQDRMEKTPNPTDRAKSVAPITQLRPNITAQVRGHPENLPTYHENTPLFYHMAAARPRPKTTQKCAVRPHVCVECPSRGVASREPLR